MSSSALRCFAWAAALAGWVTSAPANAQDADTLYLEALAAYERADLVQASWLAADAAVADPSHAPTQLLLGLIAVRAGDFAVATAVLEGVKDDPDVGAHARWLLRRHGDRHRRDQACVGFAAGVRGTVVGALTVDVPLSERLSVRGTGELLAAVGSGARDRVRGRGGPAEAAGARRSASPRGSDRLDLQGADQRLRRHHRRAGPGRCVAVGRGRRVWPEDLAARGKTMISEGRRVLWWAVAAVALACTTGVAGAIAGSRWACGPGTAIEEGGWRCVADLQTICAAGTRPDQEACGPDLATVCGDGTEGIEGTCVIAGLRSPPDARRIVGDLIGKQVPDWNFEAPSETVDVCFENTVRAGAVWQADVLFHLVDLFSKEKSSLRVTLVYDVDSDGAHTLRQVTAVEARRDGWTPTTVPCVSLSGG